MRGKTTLLREKAGTWEKVNTARRSAVRGRAAVSFGTADE